MRSIEAIRNANRPGPPEHSIPLRVACLGAVVVAIAASASMDEIAGATALWGIGLASLGMGFSYVTRSHPPGWIKLVVAAGAIAASVWFFHAVSGPMAGIANVEDPLIVLLLSILVLHSFHVPSRRDLTFSLAAAAGLMAVGGAAGNRPPFRLVRTCLGGFQPRRTHADVEIGEWRWANVGDTPRVGILRSGRRGSRHLSRPSGANRRRQAQPFRPGGHRRCRRGPGRTRGRCRFPFTAGPTRKSHRTDPCRRLPRICPQSGHRAPGKAGQHAADVGPRATTVVLGG